MFEGPTCQHNQTGFCKFRQNCRKRHENRVCQENHDFKSSVWSLRHPKVCRSYKSEGTCKFKDDCAYKHQNIQEDAINQGTNNMEDLLKHKADICALKNEINQHKMYVF